MTQGSPALTASGEVDLDAVGDEIDLSPVPVRLAGQVYTVRRDLTGAEVQRFWQLSAAKDDLGALRMLVGIAAEQLNAALEQMPNARMLAVMRAILVQAGLVEESGKPAGESPAS